MDKFLNDEIEFMDVSSVSTSGTESLAGGAYTDHVQEINSMIDEANRSNAEAYRKASFCAIGA